MTKVLNIDDIETTNEKIIVIDKVEHTMKPLSVEDFVNNMKELEEIERLGANITPSEAFERSLKMILASFPTLPEARIRSMNVVQIDSLFSFIQGEVEAETERGVSSGN